MHIEPGVVHGAKMMFAVATAAGAGAYTLKLTYEAVKNNGTLSLTLRAVIATLAVLFFFEILPKFSVGISEVHFIFGATVLLMLGTAPAAIGLAASLAIQSFFFAPYDLPMYFVNVTTLLAPLFMVAAVVEHSLPKGTAFVDLNYSQALKLSAFYQGGIIAWVAFWAFYGQGFGAENMASVMTFGAAYASIIIIEPIATMGALCALKKANGLQGSGFVSDRLYG